MDHLRGRAPIVWLALAAAAGRLAGERFGLPGQAALLAGFLLWHHARPDTRRPAWLMALAACAGALLALPAARPPEHLPAGPGLVSVRLRVTSMTERGRFGNRRLRAEWEGVAVRVVVEGRGASPPVGATLSGTAWYEPASPDSDAAPLLRIRADDVAVRPGPLTPARVRAELLGALERTVRRHMTARTAPLALRLLVGRGRDLDPGAARDHRRAGLAHLLAISGLHAVLIAQLLGGVLRLVLGRRPAAFAVLALLLVGYAWITGFRPPVLRAVTGYLLWRWCRERGRPFALTAALGAAAALTVFCTPSDLGSVSFCLSYVAVLGLGYLTPLLRPRRMPGNRWARATADAVVAATAATIATAPLCLEWFGYVAPGGILAAPIAIPIVAGLLALALFVPPLSLLLPVAGDAGFFALDTLAGAYLDLAGAVATLPASPVHALGWPPAGVLPVTLVAGLTAASLLGSPRVWLATCIAGTLLFFVPWPPKSGRGFELLAVGHGQAALCTGASGTLAVDTGDSVGGGLAASRLAERLRASGRAALDHLVVTHADADHASGVAELLLRVRVRRVWLPESPKSAPLVRWLRRRRVPFTVLRPGSAARPLPECTVVAPHAEADLVSSNDGALAVDVRFAGGPRILVTGDQEYTGTAAALAWLRADEAPCDVLVLPHHGAPTPELVLLVEALRPELCVASTSHRRSRIASFGRPTLTTGRCGDVRVVETRRGFVLDAGAQVLDER